MITYYIRIPQVNKPNHNKLNSAIIAEFGLPGGIQNYLPYPFWSVA